MQSLHIILVISLVLVLLFLLYRRGMFKAIKWPLSGWFGSGSSTADPKLKNDFRWA
jgi:hypothetical protein